MIDFMRIRRDSRYVLFTVILAAVLFATGQIPQMLHIPPVRHWGPRPASAPSFVSLIVIRIFVTGTYHITNALHGGPSSWGPHSSVIRDQLERLLWAVVMILLCLETGARLSVRWVRGPLILAFLVGAASSLSDVASFYLHRGVVDWIGVSGVNGRVPLSILLSPTDVFFLTSIAASITLVAILLWKKIERRGDYGCRELASIRSSRSDRGLLPRASQPSSRSYSSRRDAHPCFRE